MRWLGGGTEREAWFNFKFKPGQVLECAVRDESGHTQGTIAIEVKEKRATGPVGHFVECRFITASDPHYRWWANEGPGKALSKKAVYHFCDTRSDWCNEKFGRQAVIHVEKFRMLTREVSDTKSPAWMFSRACFPAMEPFLKNLPKTGGTGDAEDLPWLDQENADVSEESEYSDETENEDMKKKVAQLKKELAAAEKRLKPKRRKKRRTTPQEGENKDKEAKKRRNREKGTTAAKDAGRRKRRTGDDSSSEGARPGNAREGDRKRSRGRKRSHDRRRRKKASSAEDHQEKLFGGHGTDSESSGSIGGRKGDRGPFGTAAKEKFRTEKDDDSSSQEGSVFREAPTQAAASNQLKLTEYSLKHPGRLAARLLLRMHRESSLASVGATLGKRQTPAAALHYLQTMMLPALGQRANVRTSRELKTLCTVLDLMAQHKMAQGADIIAQRVKALERACLEGHWGAAQFLELIGGEQQGLLERAEEYYLSKEYMMDMKVKGLDRAQHRPAKGDQKGTKGRGGKNERDKGSSAGKGKNKTDNETK